MNSVLTDTYATIQFFQGKVMNVDEGDETHEEVSHASQRNEYSNHGDVCSHIPFFSSARLWTWMRGTRYTRKSHTLPKEMNLIITYFILFQGKVMDVDEGD